VLKREHCGAGVIQNDIRNTWNFTMAGNGDGGNLQTFGNGRVYRDEPFDSPLLEEQRIFFEQVGPVAVAHNKIKVSFLQKMIFDSGHDQCCIAFADFRDKDADGVAALLAERAGKMIRPIVELARGLTNQFLRMLRN